MKTTQRLVAFFHDNRGATAIEYGLLAALIAVALIASLQNLTARMSGVFSEISSTMK